MLQSKQDSANALATWAKEAGGDWALDPAVLEQARCSLAPGRNSCQRRENSPHCPELSHTSLTLEVKHNGNSIIESVTSDGVGVWCARLVAHSPHPPSARPVWGRRGR